MNKFFNVILFLPLVGLLAKATTILIPGREEGVAYHLKYLDNRVLSTPPIALAQARSETRRMARIVLEVVDETSAFLVDNDLKRLSVLQKKEALTDILQKEISDFLVALSQKSIALETSKEVSLMMQ